MNATASSPPLTLTGRQRLRDEQTRLRKRLQATTERLKDELPDKDDLNWYLTQEELVQIHGRLNELQAALVTEPEISGPMEDGIVGPGSRVIVQDESGREHTHLAINVMRRRMQDAFPGINIEVIGEPKDLSGARELAAQDKYQFQWWALDLIDAQPVSGRKKGMDRGIDGVIPFFAGPREDYKRALVSVKGGEQINPSMIRDLKGVLEREKEYIGVFLTLRQPTQEMRTEAATAGFWHSDYWQRDFARIQILTIEDVLAGKRPNVPSKQRAYTEAPLEREQRAQAELL